MKNHDIIKTVDEDGTEHVKVVMLEEKQKTAKEEKPKTKNTANS